MLRNSSPDRAIKRAWLWHLGVVAVYISLFVFSAQIQTIRAQSPWGDDPYDAIVSYAILLVPAITFITGIRMFVYTNRAILIIRGIILNLAIIFITLLADVAGAVMNTSVPKGEWTQPLIDALMVSCILITGLSLLVFRYLQLSSYIRLLFKPIQHQSPDLLDDVAALLGIARQQSPFFDHLSSNVRNHSWSIVLLSGVVFGVVFSAWHAVVEGPWPNLVAAGIFALIAAGVPLLGFLLFNSYLNFIRNSCR